MNDTDEFTSFQELSTDEIETALIVEKTQSKLLQEGSINPLSFGKQ
jgi:hypothetical protein